MEEELTAGLHLIKVTFITVESSRMPSIYTAGSTCKHLQHATPVVFSARMILLHAPSVRLAPLSRPFLLRNPDAHVCLETGG